jgi:hypothetical protein
MNRNFLKEAIADAKTVKESAIANAKVALEEAFSPKLQAMFAQKLEEMDQEEMDEEYDEVDEAREVDKKMSNPVMRRGLKGDNTAEKETEDMREEEDMSLDEILAELEKEDLREDERTDAEEEGYLDGMKEEDEDMEVEEDEDIDLENMSEEDLKSFIEDVIADMVKAGELEAGDAIEDEDDVETEEDEDIKEAKEVNGKKSMDEGLLDFLKKKKKEAPKAEDSPKLVGVDFDGNYIYSDDPNLSKKSYAELGEGVKRTNEDYSTEMLYNVPEYQKMIAVLAPLLASLTGFAISYVKDKLSKGGDEAEKLINIAKKQSGSQAMSMNEALKTVKILKSELNEINLLNAKLLYSNKIFKTKNLNESQKVKVLGAFDRAKTVKETKIVFETLNENFKIIKKTLHEGVVGYASKAILAPKTNKQPIVESDEMVNRFKKLAGII